MNNKGRWFVIIALIAIIGFSLGTCDNGNGNGGTAPTITTTALPDMMVGMAYNLSLEATGDDPITWSLEGGALPTGLTLFGSGAITGTPTTANTYTFTVKATNAAGNDIKKLSITVNGTAPTITTDALPYGTVGEEYNYTLEATGETPIIWILDGGELPPGVYLEGNGAITGTPTEVNTFTFTVRATNAIGDDIKELSITINKLAPTIITETLPDGTRATAYDQILEATGIHPITWSIESGALPTGLSLEATTGTFTGTPTVENTFIFTVLATNAAGNDTKQLSITINGIAPTITTATLPAGTVETAYSQALAATGDDPITWSIESGALPTGLSLEATTGTITGTPTVENTFTFTVLATNATGNDTKQLSITINGLAPTITTATLPNGTVGTAYSQTLAATGDTPITWIVESGALPTGLSLEATTGAITGTPTAANIFTFTVKATNTIGNDTKQLSITIATAPTITTATLPGGTVGIAYSQTLAATGDDPITWSIEGVLPTGLNLAETGTITGMPTAVGTFTFIVKATNAAGYNTKQLSIIITGVPPTITTTALTNGTMGTAYSQTLAATGSTPITWSLDGGALPTGLSIAESGVISGTPTTAGTSTFIVKATNAAGNATKQFSITIAVAPVITTATLPGGLVGTAYGQTLTATGDTPITWSLDGGALPTGLSIAESGVISGTPTTAGTSTFIVKATNVAGNNTKQFSITIAAAPVITTAALPDGVVGTAYGQTLAATGDRPITWSLDGGALPTGLSIAESGVISGTPTTVGTSTFTVGATNAAGNRTKQFSIKIIPEVEMIQIPAGTFIMGSLSTETGRNTDETRHTVTLTSNFYMGKYPVTQAQYQAVMGNNPSYFKNYVSPETSTANRPVEQVSWYDAVEFCNKLSEKAGLTSAYTISGRTPATGYPITSATVSINWSANGYRLPTEAQWEYACRAGTTTAYNTGATINSNTGWYTTNSSNRTHSVGEKLVNAWGLYDMHGNVYEWCWDWYGPYNGAQTDPLGAGSGDKRVIRGGAWSNLAQVLRSAMRVTSDPSIGETVVGFRIVRPYDGPIITTESLPGGTRGIAYTQTLTALANIPFTWSLESGALPAGLSLEGAGTITGTPTEVGTFTFTVKAVNAAGNDTKQFSITIVTPVAPTITTTSTSLPNATVGVAYSATLTATGTTPITWSLDDSASPFSLAENGTITGTATTAGTRLFWVRATNIAGTEAKRVSITSVNSTAVAPTITTAALPGGEVGTAYNQALTATGTTPITWSLESGALPEGLSLAGSGAISGRPTAEGTSTFTVRATNTGGYNTKQFSITIAPPVAPTITIATLPGGELERTYRQTLTATGTTPITWSLESGALPVGLSLAPTTGVISGTPIVKGTSTFTVKAANSVGNDTKQFSITTGEAPVIINATLLPIGTVGMAYNLTLETRDGDKPITWSLESGTLPTGLSLAETGVIYGTPTAAGTSAFALKATNAVGNHAVQTSMTITASINRIPIEMVQIPAGTFMMGSPDTEPGRFSGELQHQVTLTTGFRMGKYPVTQAQYQAVTGMNPSLWRTPVFPETNMANRPVEFVSWYEAVEFCNKLSIQEGLTPVYTITDREPATGYPFSATVTANWSVSGYRLPTEAQWEYACRAGTTTAYNTGDNITADQANYIDTMYQERTTEVGSFAPNAWGLHDMHGNVNEWCWDLMDSYGFDTQTDPTGPAVPPNYYLFMIFRGGCFLDDSSYIRSARRNSQPPLLRWGALGFRVVRPL